MTGSGVVAFCTALLVLAATGSAHAGNVDHAEEAFQRGRTFLGEGRYAEACQSFEESQREDPASGTLLALAYCQELSGLLASAYKNYRAAAELAQTEGKSERRDAATQQSKALEQRVSVLTILVPPNLAGNPALRVMLDGAEVGRAKFGTPIPVNGGNYRVEAVVGGASWSTNVAVKKERDAKTLIVELAVAPPEPAPPAAVPPARSPPRDRGRARTLEVVSAGLAIGSAVSLAGGAAFALRADAKNRASNRDGHCNATGCDERGVALRNNAFSAAHTATWLVVTSGILAAGAAGLYVGTTLGLGEHSARIDASVALGGVRVLVTEPL